LRLSFLLAALGLALVATGCEDACRQLANQICRCSASPREQSACEVRLDSNARGRSPTTEEQEQCEALLDICSCEDLQLGQRQACGLTELPEGVF
jgi:hypothetical protein